MLTTDLLRVRMLRGEVRPRYVDPDDANAHTLAGRLSELIREHIGKTRGQLEDSLADEVGEGTDFLLHRGLTRILLTHATIEPDAACDPIELRRRVFERAAAAHPVACTSAEPGSGVTRADVLAEVAASLGITADEAERALFADLARSHVLRHVEPLSAAATIHRYNLALAQTVLLRATSLTITIAPGDPARYRQLFRFIKFYRLMHSVEGTRTQGYTIRLDGPLSLFQLSSKYGLQIASFLPALLLCDGWTLHAELLWGTQRRPAVFRLNSGCGLVSHYPDKGVYITDEERHFVDRFSQLDTNWRLERAAEIVDLDGHGVLIPDYVLRHAETAREVLLEIVGFWRKSYLESRLDVLNRHGPSNLILAVSTRLRSTREQLSEFRGEVVMFRDLIPTKDVLERAERVGRARVGSASV